MRDTIKTTKTKLKAIYSELGGETQLREILNEFYRRMSEDILIGYFFTGKDLHAIAEKQLEFLLVAMGIKSQYTGKSPSSAHLELPPILKGHFDRRLVILKETLKDYGLPEDLIKNWIEFENAFRNVIIS